MKRIIIVLSLVSVIIVNFGLGMGLLLFPPVTWALQNAAYTFSHPSLPHSTTAQATQAAFTLVLFEQANQNPFSPAETGHLLDVNHVLGTFLVVWVASLLLLSKTYRILSRKILLITAAVIAIGSILAAAFFSPFFELFHKLFFPQGNYAFPANSLIIQTFPLEFWLLGFLFVEIVVCGLLLLEARHAERRKF